MLGARNKIILFSVVALIIGLGAGFIARNSEIHTLNESRDHLNTIIKSKNETIVAQQETVDSMQVNIKSLSDELSDLETDYSSLESLYNQLEENATKLIDLYNQLTLIESIGTPYYTPKEGVTNGDFSDYSDGVVGWLTQGKNWHNEDGVYLYQYPSSSFMVQNIPIKSKTEGIRFNVKPVTLGASVSLQVAIDGIPIFEKTYETDLDTGWETIIIPFKYLFEMRELYSLPEKETFELRYTIPSGPDNGAHMFIDEISLVEISYRPPIDTSGWIIEDDFSSDSGYWNYQGTAYRDSNNEYIVLTELESSNWGHIWLKQPVTGSFSVSFRYKIGGGTGADGIALLFYQKDTISAPDRPEQMSNVVGAVLSGGHDTNGCAVEFDCYRNSHDPSNNHVGLRDSSTRHLAYANDPRTEDYQWHDVEVVVDDSSVEVYLDSDRVINWVGTITPQNTMFGFGGACGADTNFHMIDDITISISPS